MKIRYRKQRHCFSCGLACVAMVADKPYNAVVKDFRRYKGFVRRKLVFSRWIYDYATSTADVLYLLKKYGIKSAKVCVPYTGKRTLPDLAMLEVQLRKEPTGTGVEDCWHWVVACREGRSIVLYDPLKGIRELSYKDRIHYYLEIKK